MANDICGKVKAVAQDMSLLTDKFEDFVELEKTVTPDGLGGYIVDWRESTEFKAAITFNSSMQAKIAAAMGVKSLYTVTTRKDYVLYYHDVIKRLSDGKIFRITSDGDDSYTPPSARLNMRQVTAEEWAIPDTLSEVTDGD